MTLPPNALADLRSAFADRLLIDEPLARHTSARIGGPADAFIAADTIDDLRTAARIAWAHDVPLFVLGGGSNILISDRGVRGIVVANRTGEIDFDGTTITADSGVGTIPLVRRCITRGLSGLEWAVGVPGTVGGAVIGNAGAHGSDMSKAVSRVLAATPEGDTWLTTGDLEYEYRSSIFKREPHPVVILRAEFALREDDLEAIKARAAEFNARRKRTQPPGATIGSMFMNPPGDHAGRLIEAAGLKGKRIGGAQISEKHANFFLNAEDATAADVRALVDLARREVLAQFGISLELEVEMVGEWTEG
ncbi:MAG: UDP-N-acetylmuramate dehydrogenase [Anaerolineae bacterium]|nr:UDP-N-acetylmuramate dehydrogenase [Anaerolineae bacterium]